MKSSVEKPALAVRKTLLVRKKNGRRIETDNPIAKAYSNPLVPILESMEPGQRYVDDFDDKADDLPPIWWTLD
jgi:hypothetical protein